MPLHPSLQHLTLPVIGSPMFIVSSPDMVIAQCRAGIVGTLPSLNLRTPEELEPALAGIADAVGHGVPFGVNLIAHRSNARLEHDLSVCVKRRVPIIITSLGASSAIVDRIHDYGGLVLHDVISARHAEKAAQAGVDGIIAVAAGAGGHGGTINPFALCAEVRRVFDGMVILAGAISTGADVAAARAAGADLAYMGTRLIATREANASDAYKKMIVDGRTDGIVYTPYFSGVPGNYLRDSVVAAGLDPTALPMRDSASLAVSADGTKAKAWKDVWSAGHGVAAIAGIPTIADLVVTLRQDFDRALTRAAWPEA